MRFIRVWSGYILLPKIVYLKNTKYKRYAASNHYKRFCYRVSIRFININAPNNETGAEIYVNKRRHY